MFKLSVTPKAQVVKEKNRYWTSLVLKQGNNQETYRMRKCF